MSVIAWEALCVNVYVRDCVCVNVFASVRVLTFVRVGVSVHGCCESVGVCVGDCVSLCTSVCLCEL